MASSGFWSTTSGMATGVAGTLTGVVGLATLATQMGWVGGTNDPDQQASSATSTSAASTTTSADPSPAGDDRTVTTQGASRSASGVTTTSGVTTSATAEPAYTVDPSAVSFRAIGDHTASVSVRNTGNVELVVSDVAVEGDDAGRFAVESGPCTSAPIGPGRSCALEITFTPPSSGEAKATLAIEVEDARAREVPLSGAALL